MNFTQKWNIDLQKIAEDLFLRMDEKFQIKISTKALEKKIQDIFTTPDLRKEFYHFFEETYEVNLKRNSNNMQLLELIYILYKKEILVCFESDGINNDFSTDYELFKLFMKNPEIKLTEYIKKVLQKGLIFCVNGDYICIRWVPDLLGIDVIIKKIDKTFKIISVYPCCREGIRNYSGFWYPDEYEVGDNTEMSVGSSSFDFFDNFIAFDKNMYDSNSDEDFACSFWALAVSCHNEYKREIDEKDKISRYIDYDCISDEIYPFLNVSVCLKDLVEFTYLNKKIYMFFWAGNQTVKDEPYFDNAIPVFIPGTILPKDMELFSDGIISLTIFLFGHQSVYENTDEPKLEEFKFKLITNLLKKE